MTTRQQAANDISHLSLVIRHNINTDYMWEMLQNFKIILV